VFKTTRLICVYEGTKQFGIGTEVAAAIVESAAFDRLDAPIIRLGGADCPLPYNPELEKAAVPQVPDIVDAIRRSVQGRV
jgi:pyruvate dehydrogenase E1 component beta subunit